MGRGKGSGAAAAGGRAPRGQDAGGGRAGRMAAEIQRWLPEILRQHFSTVPRADLVSVTRVGASRDLSVADIGISLLLGTDEEVTETARALNKVSGAIRARLAARLQTRYAIALRFHMDVGLREADRLAALITRTRREDRQRAEEAGAVPAEEAARDGADHGAPDAGAVNEGAVNEGSTGD